ncbi:hypothetical protein [Paenibacillus lautus]|uniref:hypothetical protein n=1 Tax=Paenibacillus lautus TaxID=1401 RepID=UPI0013C51ECD|nr:hypothetical protein [Paenibacillus lautus]
MFWRKLKQHLEQFYRSIEHPVVQYFFLQGVDPSNMSKSNNSPGSSLFAIPFNS